MDFKKILKSYDYSFPPELIAQAPATPRDSARLLVYNKKTDKVCYDTFLNLATYLPPEAVLVFNETRVIPARFEGTKDSGGKVRVLYIANDKSLIKAMADRKIPIGAKVSINKKVFFVAEEREGKYYFFRPSFPLDNLYKVLEKFGQAPLPPYIKLSPLGKKELKEKYQAVFARRNGSVAAPTASLHFTDRLLKNIKQSGCDIKFVTLHVNLGTFAPLEEKNIKDKKLHKEYYEIDKKTADFLNQAKKEGRPIVAVGTTVARTLESAVRPPAGGSPQAADEKRILKKLRGTTDIFIQPGYQFKFVDGIITNFHVPRSSLLMLVAALVGRKKLFDLYQKAIKKKFKLFSFGDGMIVF